MTYTIKAVDGDDDDIAETIHELQRETLPLDVPIQTEFGHWWLVFHDGKPVAFAGLDPYTQTPNVGYLCRAGVLPAHRGHGLQRRLIRVRERKARVLGWRVLVTDTITNPHSANNLIACGFRLWEPPKPWANNGAIYWRKELT